MGLASTSQVDTTQTIYYFLPQRKTFFHQIVIKKGWIRTLYTGEWYF